jgi:hypothetical protein
MAWICKQLIWFVEAARRGWGWLNPRLLAAWCAFRGWLGPRAVAVWCAVVKWLRAAWCAVVKWLRALWHKVQQLAEQQGAPKKGGRRAAAVRRAHLVGMLTAALLVGIAAGMIGYRVFLEEPVRVAERATIAPATLGPPAPRATTPGKGAQQKKFRIRGAEDFSNRTGDSGR